jgi:Domain of unknown function (DUF1707)
MARRSTVRASDADREHVAERLRHAAGEGRLLAEELEERLARALRARTYGELDPLVADLPHPRAPRRKLTPSMILLRVMAGIAVLFAAAVVLAIAVFLATGLLAGWALWLFIGWWFFGRHGRTWYGPPRVRRGYGPRGVYSARRVSGARRI